MEQNMPRQSKIVPIPDDETEALALAQAPPDRHRHRRRHPTHPPGRRRPLPHGRARRAIRRAREHGEARGGRAQAAQVQRDRERVPRGVP